MRRLAIGLMLVAVVVASRRTTVRAEPVQQQSQVQITSPEVSQEIRGIVPIIGSALVPDFQYYKVEYGNGPDPSQWFPIGSMPEAPVVNGQLAIWDTTRLPDGVYSLRLRAVKRDGNYGEFFVRQVVIVNARPTHTPTSEPSPTPTAAAPTVSATPRATATLQIIAPSAALSPPTATPTLSRPQQRQVLPVDPKDWQQAFCYGALATGAVFVLLGIVFGLRRLL
ncbi:MAG: hypothetical protein E3J25_00425 [Anaerolineales bacterium]|nr:MAG: hypothetical protein E3J25_00425 [Anaerolineales bacterium]